MDQSSSAMFPLDNDQNRAVESGVNTVVIAGAGSGKTTVLARRYVDLLIKRKADVESILTLTFTRKAAAEMYLRIYGLLRSVSDDPFLRNQAERFDQSWISTLDAFCSTLVRNDSLRYGIPPDFSTDEQALTELLSREALTFLVESREDCLIALVRRMGFERVRDGFIELATSVFTFGKRIDFQELLNTQLQHLQAEKKILMERAGKIVKQLEALDLSVSSGREGEKAREVQERLQGGGKTIEGLTDALKGVRLPGKTSDPNLIAYKEYIQELRTLKEPLSQIERTEQAREELEAVYEVLGKYQERVEQAKRTSGILSFKDVAELAVEILIHNEDLRTWFKRKFKAILIDEFQDNNRLQKDLLFLLAEKEDRSTKGIPDPSDIDPSKLFFVGDEKQSIYRFRGADVRVFKHLSEELRGIGGEDVHLVTNYRSHPSLIQFFNLLFQRIMPPVQPGLEDASLKEPPFAGAYEACFEPMEPPPRYPVQNSDAPHVHIFWRPYREEENPVDENEEEVGELHADEMEAYFLACKIRDWVENRTLQVRDKESGTDRPAEYRDFALLLRSTGNQIHYERMLRRLNIPYTTIGIRSLFLESPVNDMYAFLQCALYPEDRLAYATLLRSPFVHLGDEALLEVLLQNKPPFEPGEEVFEFSPIDALRFSRGRELYQNLSRKVDTVSVPELLSYLWYEGGYRYTVLRNPSFHPYLELYDYLREFALLVPGETLAAFLDRLRPNLGKYERIPELTIQRDSVPGVQILTIHKAKGLEYPVVILANAGNRGRKGEGTNLFYLSEQYGLTVTLGTKGDTFNYFYQKGKEENEAGEEAELKRLFYVACTRAESHLVISGCFNKQNRPSSTPKETGEAESSRIVQGERAFLPMLFRALQIPIDEIPAQTQSLFEIEMIPNVKEKDLEEEVETGTPTAFIPEIVQALYEKEPFFRKMDQREYSVTGWVEQMNQLNQAAFVAAHPKDSGGRASVSAQVSPASGLSAEVDALFRGDDTSSLEEYFGSLCHGAIENRIMQDGLDRLEFLKSHCPLEDAYPILEKEAYRLADQFLESEAARALLEERNGKLKREVEVPFLLKAEDENGPLWIHGRMDLVLVGMDRVRVLDFKTDRYIQPEQHAAQLSLYRQAALEIWKLPVETYLVYLRFGEIIPVPEES